MILWTVAAVVALTLGVGCGGGSRRARTPVALPPAAPHPTTPPAPVEPLPEKPAPAAPGERDKPSPLSPAEDLLLGFEGREYISPGGRLLRYRLFRPPGYDAKKRYPLIVFLHGSSGAGVDNRRQLTGSRRAGVELWVSPRSQAEHPAFVLAPQADPAHAPTWVRQWRVSPRADPARAEPLELVVELLDELARELSIDTDRVYLTGYSMGGFGTWIGVSRHPRRFAAAVPIAGGGDPTHAVDTEAAVWAFHGARDRVVPVRRSREMIRALERAGEKPLYTEYPDAGHEIWERVYEEPGLADWLFKQHLK